MVFTALLESTLQIFNYLQVIVKQTTFCSILK
jgi:hypothetical protein